MTLLISPVQFTKSFIAGLESARPLCISCACSPHASACQRFAACKACFDLLHAKMRYRLFVSQIPVDCREHTPCWLQMRSFTAPKLKQMQPGSDDSQAPGQSSKHPDNFYDKDKGKGELWAKRGNRPANPTGVDSSGLLVKCSHQPGHHGMTNLWMVALHLKSQRSN